MSHTVVDLFAGAGGFSAGMKAAGYQVIAAIDSDKKACETHASNYPDSKIVCDGIENLDPAEFCEQVGIKGGSVDVVVGGPPCQTFSTIGLAKIRSVSDPEVQKVDPRNYLFQTFFEYVEHLRPRVFVMENFSVLKAK